MTPEEFIAKWRAAQLKERSAAQEHFIDLCRLLDEPTRLRPTLRAGASHGLVRTLAGAAGIGVVDAVGFKVRP